MPDINNAFSYFTGQGYTPSAAAGISAGLFAESGLNPNAVNPTSGAYGIGQWLGARKQALFNLFGSSPTMDQQLSFVNLELGQGNGGGAISGSATPQDALSNFITKFERPGPGTAGDISRGTRALGNINMTGGSGLSTAQNLWDQAVGIIDQPAAMLTDLFGGNVAIGAGATQTQAQTTAQAKDTGGLFGPLIDWFNGLVKGFEEGVGGFLERGGFIIVGLILIAAGLVYIAASNKTVQQVAVAAVV